MKIPKSLTPAELRRRCDPQQFNFKTTTEVPDVFEFIGQDRAREAVKFGINIKHEGYNVFALGPPGVGKHSLIRKLIEDKASKLPVPPDWCYVFNFTDPTKPIAMQLPAGQGTVLRADMDLLIEELNTSIPAIFESDAFRNRMQKIVDEYEKKQKKKLADLQEEAKESNMIILSTPEGFVVAPAKDGKVITSKEYSDLPEKERNHKDVVVTELSTKLSKLLKQIPRMHRERHRKERELQREFAMSVVGQFIHELKEKYQFQPQVLNYLDAVQHDVVNNVKEFLRREDDTNVPLGMRGVKNSALTRYQINLIVDHSDNGGAPVIYEENPTYQNLIGRVEHVAQLGTLLTDFTLIRPGALHLANGGYLMIDAHKLLTQPFAWDVLKRSLYAHAVTIELPSQVSGFLSTVSLEPEAIPLDLKVIILGDRTLYYMLCELDTDFCELFKVEADFNEDLDRSDENIILYAQVLATLVRKEKLRPFSAAAIAHVIDHSTRLTSDMKKLSAHMRSITDLLREADYWAGEVNADLVMPNHVQQAIDHKIWRADRVRENVNEEISRNILLIDTTGAKIGQVNGLSIVELGALNFGHPTRITATTHLGKGEVIDIEREVELGGSIHSKGVMILTGFLGGRYAHYHTLSLSASIVMEQSYSQVEGDSASAAELCAMLSSLSRAPIKQSLAITGSVNQQGEIQAVGGINEKIESFFDVCNARGLTGEQGVIIPDSNAQHLMLHQEVIDAVAAGKFTIYLVKHIDEAIELLTGVAAGERDTEGKFPPDTINYRVQACLDDYSEKAKEEITKESEEAEEDGDCEDEASPDEEKPPE